MTRKRSRAPRPVETAPATVRFVPGPWMVFAVALAVRLLHVWQMQGTPFFATLMGDSRGYDRWAAEIAGGDWLGREVFYQAPLYPYFLGALYSLFGRDLLLVRVDPGGDRRGRLRRACGRRTPLADTGRGRRRRADAGALSARDLLRRPASEVGARRVLRMRRACRHRSASAPATPPRCGGQASVSRSARSA